MSVASDPFAHHPELRDRIVDPAQSIFRTFRIEDRVEQMRAAGQPIGWWYSDSEREACRGRALADRRDSDLWVFAYGSLMWDPGFHFEEVRRAHAPDYARRFILKSTRGGRGSPNAPGVVAALDRGEGCEGLAFRIARDNIEAETEILWRRERIAPAYIPAFIDTVVAHRPVTALAFVADHAAESIVADLPRVEQIHLLATGNGFRGTSLEYLARIAEQFAALGIEDEDVSALLRETEAYRRARQSR